MQIYYVCCWNCNNNTVIKNCSIEELAQKTRELSTNKMYSFDNNKNNILHDQIQYYINTNKSKNVMPMYIKFDLQNYEPVVGLRDWFTRSHAPETL